jgi:hypothetical protein
LPQRLQCGDLGLERLLGRHAGKCTVAPLSSAAVPVLVLPHRSRERDAPLDSRPAAGPT